MLLEAEAGVLPRVEGGVGRSGPASVPVRTYPRVCHLSGAFFDEVPHDRRISNNPERFGATIHFFDV
jgi:hypothetical protein